MNQRAVLGLILAAAFLALSISLVWVAIRFATPQPEYVEIGHLSDFPSSLEPYFVNDPLPVYVLSYNDTLLVLDPLNRGTFFDRYGNPTHHRFNPDYPVEKQGLLRYPVNFRGDRIFIEVSRPARNTPQSN